MPLLLLHIYLEVYSPSLYGQSFPMLSLARFFRNMLLFVKNDCHYIDIPRIHLHIHLTGQQIIINKVSDLKKTSAIFGVMFFCLFPSRDLYSFLLLRYGACNLSTPCIKEKKSLATIVFCPYNKHGQNSNNAKKTNDGFI